MVCKSRDSIKEVGAVKKNYLKRSIKCSLFNYRSIDSVKLLLMRTSCIYYRHYWPQTSGSLPVFGTHMQFPIALALMDTQYTKSQRICFNLST